jgi:hypothetical protein
MSLYNMVRGGFNPYAAVCIAMVCDKPQSIPRLRDAWLSDDGKTFTILTRTGGGNRQEYHDGNTFMKLLPGYIADRDDHFDSTFAHWLYKVPEKYLADAAICAAFQVKIEDGQEWQGPKAALDLIAGRRQRTMPKLDVDDPEVGEACAAFNRMVANARRET